MASKDDKTSMRLSETLPTWIIEDFIDQARDTANPTRTMATSHRRQLFESPIEELLASAINLVIASSSYYRQQMVYLPISGATPERLREAFSGECGSTFGVDAVIAPQVIVGDYRVDFLLTYRVQTDSTGSSWAIKNIAVECDGHDFHERTKEQAQRDKARDRWLQARDYKVLRYTGSEVWKDPCSCADSILWLAHVEIFETAGGFLRDAMDAGGAPSCGHAQTALAVGVRTEQDAAE